MKHKPICNFDGIEWGEAFEINGSGIYVRLYEDACTSKKGVQIADNGCRASFEYYNGFNKNFCKITKFYGRITGLIIDEKTIINFNR